MTSFFDVMATPVRTTRQPQPAAATMSAAGGATAVPDRRRLAVGLLALGAVLLFLALLRPSLFPGTVRQAVAGLRDEGSNPEIRKLLEAMASSDSRIAVQARDALAEWGRPVVPNLITRLEHDEARVRTAAALVLGAIADPRAVQPLSSALADAREPVRYRAAYALGRLKDPGAVPYLTPLLNDPSRHVVNVTIRALEECRCKVRPRNPLPGYEVLPLGETEWQVIAPETP
jgi:HEAT repeat protein